MTLGSQEKPFNQMLLEADILGIAASAAEQGWGDLASCTQGLSSAEWNSSGVLYNLNLLASYDGDNEHLRSLQPRASIALAAYHPSVQ